MSSQTWWQWLLGVSSDDVPADARLRFMLTNLPQSWKVFVALFAVVAAGAVCVRIYRADAAKLPSGARRTLAGLRLAVVLLLAFVGLGPALAYTRIEELPSVVVVLRDASRSMAIADRHLYAEDRFAIAKALGTTESALASEPATRAQIVNALLKSGPDSLLEALQERGQVRVLDFAESVHPLEIRPAIRRDAGDSRSKSAEPANSGPDLPRLDPTGAGTNLHHALSEALTEKKTAAVVLFTDGQPTDRATGKVDLLALGRDARERRIPLLVVGLGDPKPPRNLQMAEVFADTRVWKDDPFELQAILRSEGLAGETVHVELIEQSLDDSGTATAAERILESREVALPAEGGQTRLTFEHTSRTAGRFAYSARVQPVERESTTDDNQSPVPAEVKVIDEKARALLVAGSPNWDYRFLRQLLERETSVDVSCWLQTLDPNRAQEGNTSITKLPRVREELFAYDVILLLDPDPREFDDAWMSLLEEFSRDHAGGLLYMAGPDYTSRFISDARTSKIRGLLPVRFGDVAATDVAGLLESDDRIWDLEIVEASLDHPIMRFESDVRRSLDVWKLFPGVVWTYPVHDAAPASRTLLEHSDPALMQLNGPRPLMVTGQVGAGRTVFLGFEGTWRWREAGRNAEFFNRFWLQTVRFLVEGRSVEGKRRGSVETDRAHYEVGDRMTVVARLNDSTFEPLTQPEVKATILVPGASPAPITLRAATDQPGRYEAIVAASQPGRAVLKVDLDEAASSPTIETVVTIAPPSAEAERTWQNKPLLMEIAAASGGEYFSAGTVERIPELIPDRRRTIEIEGKPAPLWDTGRVLLLIVFLLSLEWALRKKHKLL